MRSENLKNQGQKQHTMIMLNKFIEDNIEKLFKQRDRTKDYRSLGGENFKKHIADVSQIESKDADQLTEYELSKLEKEKQVFHEFLVKEAERLVKERRIRIK